MSAISQTRLVRPTLIVERRELKNVDFKQYLNCLMEGFVKMSELTVRVHAQVMESLGISEESFHKACARHHDVNNFMP